MWRRLEVYLQVTYRAFGVVFPKRPWAERFPSSTPADVAQ